MTRVGIVGYKGRVAQRHIKAWEELGVEWEGIGSSDKMELHLGVDFFDICTPIYLHKPMIYKALALGKDVLCEKPIGLTLDEADDIILLQRQNPQRRIGIIYQFRYNPKLIQLKKEITEGKFGEIKLVTAQYYRWRGWEYYKNWEPDQEKAGGGVTLNVCIHYLDLLQWIFGFPTQLVGFSNTAKVGIDVEDNSVSIMTFPSGTIGSVILSTHVNPPKHFELSVYGTKGHKTIQLRQNEYHKENFKAFLDNKSYVDTMEAKKSLGMALRIIGKI